MLLQGIIEIDLHGLRSDEAFRKAENAVRTANGSVYIIRCIYGYHGGTAIRERLEDEFSYGRNDKVKSVRQGANPGITELVLREL